MDNSSLIREIQNHLAKGKRDAYTEGFIDVARKSIAEKNSSSEQQKQLIGLLEDLEELRDSTQLSFPGSSAKVL